MECLRFFIISLHAPAMLLRRTNSITLYFSVKIPVNVFDRRLFAYTIITLIIFQNIFCVGQGI